MSAKTAQRELATLGMKKAKSEAALLSAILTETADLTADTQDSATDYVISYYTKLSRLRTLAESIINAAPDSHPSGGISALGELRGDDFTQLARGEGTED